MKSQKKTILYEGFPYDGKQKSVALPLKDLDI